MCVLDLIEAGCSTSFLRTSPWHSRLLPLCRVKSWFPPSTFCGAAVSTSSPTCSVIEPSDHVTIRALLWRTPSSVSRHLMMLSVLPMIVFCSSSASSNVSGSNARGSMLRIFGRRIV